MNSKVFSVFVVLSSVIVLVLLLPLGIAPNIVGPNYKNVTVQTRLGITNSRPEILSVIFQDASNTSLRNITISAGSLKTVYCNATVRDWNGFNDIVYLNATIWHSLTSNYTAANNNMTNFRGIFTRG